MVGLADLLSSLCRSCCLVAAKLHPSRTYYYRKNVDVDKLIEMCTKKLTENREYCGSSQRVHLEVSMYA